MTHTGALVGLGFLVGKLFGLSADTVGLYFPAVLGPAIAVPIAATGRAIGRSGMGLAAALALVVAPGYFMRTTAGYFDTDTFAVTIPPAAAAIHGSPAPRGPRSSRSTHKRITISTWNHFGLPPQCAWRAHGACPYM